MNSEPMEHYNSLPRLNCMEPIEASLAHLSYTTFPPEAHLRLDEVVAVYGGGHGHPRQAGTDELQERHLRRGVLERHSVRPQLEVGDAPLQLLGGRPVQVAV